MAVRRDEPTTAAPGACVGRRAARQELYNQRISWPEAQERLRRHYLAVGDKPEYTRVTAILADGFPFTGALQFEAAAALIAIGRPADALRYSRRAVDLEPRNVNHLLVNAHALILTGAWTMGARCSSRCCCSSPATQRHTRCCSNSARR